MNILYFKNNFSFRFLKKKSIHISQLLILANLIICFLNLFTFHINDGLNYYGIDWIIIVCMLPILFSLLLLILYHNYYFKRI